MRTIITGAANGIGRATALLMASTDLQLTAVDVDATRLDATCADLRARGASVRSVVGDLASSAFCASVVKDAVDAFGGLDVLISNAGIMNNSPLSELGIDEWDRVFDVNVKATWLLARAAHHALKDSRGAIVVTGSIAAHHPIPAQGAYSASKAALLMLVRQLANEWAPDGIRINSVSPGMVVTGLSEQFYADESRRNRRAEQIPLREVADPERIAPIVAFAASAAAGYLTGQDILVDGGLDTALMPAIRQLADS